jgi:hypothetical protein
MLKPLKIVAVSTPPSSVLSAPRREEIVWYSTTGLWSIVLKNDSNKFSKANS